MSSDHNGIFKVPNLLLLDIDRPLPIGTHVSYVNTAREVMTLLLTSAKRSKEMIR